MGKNVEIVLEKVPENTQYEELIEQVLGECFTEEKLNDKGLYVSIMLTTPEVIWEMNKTYRNVDRPTDVLSFPMFEKNEIEKLQREDQQTQDVLGDIVINLAQVEKQAKEYGHSFERELSYMLVHGFYHLMGYDHIEEEDKTKMRQKEETILSKIGMERK